VDSARFDALAKSVAASTSRRRVLVSLAGSGLGLIGFRATEARTCTGVGTPQPADQCRESICEDGVCSSQIAIGALCDDGNPCTTNATCQVNGVCGGGTLALDGTTCDGGRCCSGSCVSADMCCSHADCTDSGATTPQCVNGACCELNGTAISVCSDDLPCCFPDQRRCKGGSCCVIGGGSNGGVDVSRCCSGACVGGGSAPCICADETS
jgi:hypothetical protein